ncbi:MAG: hypothetical protein Q8Q09_29115 [Deltaproteobacteria bacterium]|nr:hypothetical protein [Deltaproteobacteria bacterium]
MTAVLRHRRPRVAAAALLWALCLGLTQSACGIRAPRVASESLDDATIALLGAARALHSQADLYEASGDQTQAIRSIERVLTLSAPAAVREVEDVRVDAYGRLSELALSANRPADAIRYADQGIQMATRESVLHARLHLVRGRSLRALAESMAVTQSGEAATRRAEAIAALERSIQMNERVLQRALDAGVPR